ncbi:FCD domain-containing protein [Pelistega europaea]|uniref:FCD domain-containing protein n=1 Tax=Pelistega europaea TaxID=106147 RepID=A0A7Y4LAR3_9BURK|nr:FCD domain-containing protein [Pelistega europaea]NOL50018.1 FCD domain-containing protein [Pelistega europaea]
MVESSSLIVALGNVISDLGISIGGRLPAERKLCEMLSISRTRLRELLKQLTAQGFVDTRVGSGTFLKQPPSAWKIDSYIHQLSQLLEEDPNYRFDVQEARAVLEGGTAWYAALRATEDDKKQIRIAHDALLQHQIDNNFALAADADAHFHLTIAEASHNAVLIQLMRNVFELLHHNVVLARHKMYTDETMVTQLNVQHRQVMTAIEQGNAQLALESVQKHIHYVIDQIKEIDESDARLQRTQRLKHI